MKFYDPDHVKCDCAEKLHDGPAADAGLMPGCRVLINSQIYKGPGTVMQTFHSWVRVQIPTEEYAQDFPMQEVRAWRPS